MKITLYTTHCPVCRGIERLLSGKKIEYEEVTDEKVLTEKGYTHPPVLEVDGIPYFGKEITDFVQKGKVKENGCENA